METEKLSFLPEFKGHTGRVADIQIIILGMKYSFKIEVPEDKMGPRNVCVGCPPLSSRHCHPSLLSSPIFYVSICLSVSFQ